MTHDLEVNLNRFALSSEADTDNEIQDHATNTRDILMDAKAEVVEIERAVFRALTRLRATIKEFDTIARLETPAIDACNHAHHYRGDDDSEVNFNEFAPSGKEDSAKEFQDHAAKTQEVEKAEVADIKRAVFHALTRLRASTIKQFDTNARLETPATDAWPPRSAS